jgi:hypothetical protein
VSTVPRSFLAPYFALGRNLTGRFDPLMSKVRSPTHILLGKQSLFTVVRGRLILRSSPTHPATNARRAQAALSSWKLPADYCLRQRGRTDSGDTLSPGSYMVRARMRPLS